MSNSSLKPFIRFNILDNPYGCLNNILKLEFTIPLHLSLIEKGKFQNYSMIWDQNRYQNNKNIYKDCVSLIEPKVKTLLNNFLINNQTATISNNSFRIIYQRPLILYENDINKFVIYPGNNILKSIKEINNTDMYIKLYKTYDHNFINWGVWKKIN